MNVHVLPFALKIVTLLQWWYVKKFNVKNEAKCKMIIFLLSLSLFLLACNIFIAKKINQDVNVDLSQQRQLTHEKDGVDGF